MEVTDIRFLEELGEVVDRLTTSGEPSLNSDLLKKLKCICKKSDVYVKHTYYLVLTQLRKCHAEIRLSSFQIINELFFRSHAFRELLLADFGQFLELTVETDHKQPLPPPKCTAKILKGKVLEAVECWFQKFGTHYKKLHLGYCYLKRIKKVEFNVASTRTEAERRQTEERERRRTNLINGQIIRVESEMSEMAGEMRLCATEMENCLKLLLPHPNDYQVLCGEEETECLSNSNSACNKRTYDCQRSQRIVDSQIENIQVENYVANDANHNEMSEYSDLEQMNDDGPKNSTNQQLLSVHGLATRSYELSIKLNRDGPDIKETAHNSILVNTLKELHKEVAHKHLPQINKWLSVLSKGEDMQSKIQQLIDLKRELETAKNKFLELKITPMALDDATCDNSKHRQTSPVDGNDNSDNEDGSDDSAEFEDVPEKEGLELVIPPNKRADYGLEPLPTVGQTVTESSCQDTVENTEFLKTFGSNRGDLGDPTSRTTALFHMKHKLSSNGNSSAIPGDSEKVTDERKKVLLQKAPIVPYDMDLYFWDDPSAQVPKMIKTYLDNHWCSKEYEGEYLLGDEKDVRPTRIVTFAGNFEPVKWSCRAPLPSGKLCPRQDRVKCPFHGKIIPRDETGAAANPDDEHASTSAREVCTAAGKVHELTKSAAEWEEVQRDIEAAIGVDLGGRKKRVRKSSSKRSNKKKELAEKRSSLTNLKKKSNTSRNRIEKVVLNKAAMRRVADEMDAIATRRCQNKFGNQFNYALSK